MSTIASSNATSATISTENTVTNGSGGNNNSYHNEIPFFGGAIVTKFPTKFIDVSDFRLVPDHQEVWTENAEVSPLAFICEILEYKKDIKDVDSAKFFFDDLASLNNIDNKKMNEIINTNLIKQGIYNKAIKDDDDDNNNSISLPHLPIGTTVNILKGRSAIDKRKDGTVKSECITWLANIRLPQVSTDILITLTLPVKTFVVNNNNDDVDYNNNIDNNNNDNKEDTMKNTTKTNSSNNIQLETNGDETFRFILKNFNIKNWGLFGCEEENVQQLTDATVNLLKI